MSFKNYTTSKIVAKTCLRLLAIVLAFSLFILFSKGDNQAALYFVNKWAILFPILLFILTSTLLIFVLKNKYLNIEYNWLFSLSSIFMCIYLIMLYSRIFETF